MIWSELTKTLCNFGLSRFPNRANNSHDDLYWTMDCTTFFTSDTMFRNLNVLTGTMSDTIFRVSRTKDCMEIYDGLAYIS